MPKATLNGVVLAESDNTQIIEGNHYFPPDSVKKEYFKDSDSAYTCSWKGPCTFYNATVAGKNIKDVAWSYDEVITDRAKPIEKWVAFYKNKVEVK
ncbi:hypothetical protein GYMLUDRAFT_262137 [Collybiopsis luxurians FD-317 M1]|uniref:DUF427 domain-containing protein n=1 Tax=Collybiopsis luxurians FD-317 M1 TaxID=944289 RepID=A0A0D0CAA9_9AGAR|nr:hypothetical protein GYMLUDRAFT_262137 [Collybiopsis luxurians FD-317 M1]